MTLRPLHSLLVFLVVSLALLGFALSAPFVFGESVIAYPVPELGDCADESSCRAYCDELAHMEACLAFAERHNLLPPEELAEAKKFLALSGRGPGGCTDRRSCESYCENPGNIDECLAFAEEHGFMPEEELAEARKVSRALREGASLPGGCRGKDSCRAYCENPEHLDECLAFAERAGLLPAEEAKQARAFAELMKRGETPGGCRGKEACEAYCADGAHAEECIAFAEKAGFLPPEELERVKKTGGAGPGGCRGKDACEKFCNDPANRDACLAFAEEHGLIPKEEIERVREGAERLRKGLAGAPPEIAACLKDSLGGDIFEKISSGSFTPGPELAERVHACFEKARGSFPGEEGSSSPAPGGPRFDRGIPEEARRCIAEAVGPEEIAAFTDGEPPSPALERAFTLCTDASRSGASPESPADPARAERGAGEGELTPDVSSCLAEAFGREELERRLRAGEISRGEVDAVVRSCLERRAREAAERGRETAPPEFSPERPLPPENVSFPDRAEIPPSFSPEAFPVPESHEPGRFEGPSPASFLKDVRNLLGAVAAPLFPR